MSQSTKYPSVASCITKPTCTMSPLRTLSFAIRVLMKHGR